MGTHLWHLLGLVRRVSRAYADCDENPNKTSPKSQWTSDFFHPCTGRSSTNPIAMSLEPSNTGNSGVIEPVRDGRKPIAQSSRKPPRLGLELIGSVAAAAADFEGNSLGKG